MAWLSKYSPRSTALLIASVLPLGFGACSTGERAVGVAPERYRVELLAEDIDPGLIPDLLEADFDGDGTPDRVIVSDSVVRIALTAGEELQFTAGEPGQAAAKVWDARVTSFEPDGTYPSLVLATGPAEIHEAFPVTQELVYNDRGRLLHRYLGTYPATVAGRSGWAYPMRAQGLDCARLRSNALPVCFFASQEDGGLGVSRLIEMDPAGYGRLASDSATRAEYSWRLEQRRARVRRIGEGLAGEGTTVGSARQVVRDWLGVDSTELSRILSSDPSHQASSASDSVFAVLEWLSQADARRQARSYFRMDEDELDAVLAEASVPQSAEAVDYFLAVALPRLDSSRIFSRDRTRELQLPWPAQYGHGRPNVDGMFMMGAAFIDFSGDGLLDLVVVGQHSRPFSATQHPEGYFVDAAFHATPDEYVRVWAPEGLPNRGTSAPPCVYFGMEKTEEVAWRSDYVGCYDQGRKEWYDLALPGGPYWTEYDPVAFWDMNGDGTLDFAARTTEGRWHVLTFIRDHADSLDRGTGAE
jgi:hypothetical protein